MPKRTRSDQPEVKTPDPKRIKREIIDNASSDSDSSDSESSDSESSDNGYKIQQKVICIKDIQNTTEPTNYESLIRIIYIDGLKQVGHNRVNVLNVLVADHTGMIMTAMWNQDAIEKHNILQTGKLYKMRFDNKNIKTHRNPEYNRGDTKYILDGAIIFENIINQTQFKIKFIPVKIKDIINQKQFKIKFNSVDIAGMITHVQSKRFPKSNGFIVHVSDETATISYVIYNDKINIKPKLNSPIFIKKAKVNRHEKYETSISYGIILDVKSINDCTFTELEKDLKVKSEQNQLLTKDTSTNEQFDATTYSSKYKLAKWIRKRTSKKLKAKYHKAQFVVELYSINDINNITYPTNGSKTKIKNKDEIKKLKILNQLKYEYKININITDVDQTQLNLNIWGDEAEKMMKMSATKWMETDHALQSEIIKNVIGSKFKIFIQNSSEILIKQIEMIEMIEEK